MTFVSVVRIKNGVLRVMDPGGVKVFKSNRLFCDLLVPDGNGAYIFIKTWIYYNNKMGRWKAYGYNGCINGLIIKWTNDLRKEINSNDTGAFCQEYNTASI